MSEPCCPVMTYALNEGYLEPTIILFGADAGKPMPPQIPGPRLTPTGRKTKPSMIINFCPWCGAQHVPDSEIYIQDTPKSKETE